MFAYYARWIPQFSERIWPLNLAITCNDFPLSKAEVLITSIAKALWVDRTAFKKIKFKRIY